MAKFLYLYTGGQMAETPEAQEAAMQEWTNWFGTLGDSVTDIGNPFGAGTTVSNGSASDGGGGAPSSAAIRSSTRSRWRMRRAKQISARSCSPAAPWRCTKRSPCERPMCAELVEALCSLRQAQASTSSGMRAQKLIDLANTGRVRAPVVRRRHVW